MKDFPLIRSAKAAVAGALAVSLPMALLCLTPLTGLYAALLFMYLLPIALCTVGMVCGALPMAFGAAASLVSMYVLGDVSGLALSAVYLLPVLGCFAAALLSKMPFKRSAPLLIGAHVAAFAAVYLLLQRMAGGDLYTVAGDAVAAALADWELGDTMLYQFYSTGMIMLPESLKDTMLVSTEGLIVLSEAARTDLLLSVRTLVSGTLAGFVPSLIAGQSLLGGLGCLYVPIRFGFIAAEKRAFRHEKPDSYIVREDGKKILNFPTLNMPPLSLWHMPRGVGLKVFIAMAVGFFMQSGASAAMAVGGIILYAAASTLYVIQGLALINFMQKAKGVKRIWRIIVPGLLLGLSILPFVGIFDQITNIRGLRKLPQPKEE